MECIKAWARRVSFIVRPNVQILVEFVQKIIAGSLLALNTFNVAAIFANFKYDMPRSVPLAIVSESSWWTCAWLIFLTEYKIVPQSFPASERQKCTRYWSATELLCKTRSPFLNEIVIILSTCVTVLQYFQFIWDHQVFLMAPWYVTN